MPQLPFMRSQPGWTAFHKEGGVLNWLQIAPADDGRLTALACGSLPAVGADWGRTIAQTELRGKLKRRQCLLTLSHGEYQLLQAEMPSVPADEAAAALRWRIAEMLDYPAEDAAVDYAEIPGDDSRSNRTRMAYAICARRELVRGYAAGLRVAKAKLAAVDVPEMAHRNLAAIGAPSGRSVAMVGVTPEHCTFTFSIDGELCASRRIDLGAQTLAQANAESLERHFDRILLELQRSLDSFEREFYFAPLARVTVSPLPEGVDLFAFLKSNLSVAVEPLDVAARFDLSGVAQLHTPQSQSQFLTLLGSVLRPEPA